MKNELSDVVAYSALVGMGLGLLFGGLIPLLRAKTGSTEIHEHNKSLLIAETVGVAGLTIFGIVKFFQIANKNPGSAKGGNHE